MASVRFQMYRVQGGVTWRFLSANNRCLGVAANASTDVAGCRASIVELHAALSTVVGTTTRHGRDRWTWRVRAGETELAVASRDYLRRVAADSACRSFIDLVAIADVADVRRLAAQPGRGSA